MNERSTRVRTGPAAGSMTPIEARYSNYFEVAHSAFEFVIDFGQYHPESESTQTHTRIVLGTVYAKLLGSLLTDAIARCEAAHGPIPETREDIDLVEVVERSLARSNS